MKTHLFCESYSILYTCLTFIIIKSAMAADPCFDMQDPANGSIGNCIPSSSCTTNVTVANACPSFPSDYVCCFSDLFPGRETRGVWIATVVNIDWPPVNSSVETQKESIESLIDKLEDAGMNAIYFQVRPAGDALYKSNIEPWSKYLTGSQGQAPDPFWDPLEHVIDYAHGKNMQVHAWINPYRASMSPSTDDLAPNHMAKQFPQYAYPYETYLWMDPGAQVVQNRTFDVVIDIVTHYDLDGIHMDDYFYPYPISTGKAILPFPDDKTYADYIDNEGGILAKDDWRRENVNKLVRRLNEGIHKVKPFIQFSVSPFGIYRACHEEGMPCSIQGFDQYNEIYCDAKLWLVEGYVDVLQPQLYWKIEPPAQSYPVLLDWWVSQNNLGRYVYAGNFLSRVLDGWPLSELTDQIEISRTQRTRGSWGNIQFSAQIFDKDYQGAISHFKEKVYQFSALSPPFPWLATDKVPPPELPFIEKTTRGLRLQADTVAHKIVIYEFDQNEGIWHIKKIITKNFKEDLTHLEITLDNPGNFAISTIDRYGQESQKYYHQN